MFSDQENTQFIDRREFIGSVFDQLEETLKYLDLNNKTTSSITGIERIDKKDYPDEAIREALINALVHRDYGYSGSIIINVNDLQMEFVSIGGLLLGLSASDIRNGISQPRNKNLAGIFYRLRLIESYGTGIKRIFKLYDECEVKPQIIVTPNTFKLVLPNMNMSKMSVHQPGIQRKTDEQKALIIKYLSENESATEDDLIGLLEVKKTRAYYILRKMIEEGLIVVNGRGRSKIYNLSAPLS